MDILDTGTAAQDNEVGIHADALQAHRFTLRPAWSQPQGQVEDGPLPHRTDPEIF
jgi:hypothetical protein